MKNIVSFFFFPSLTRQNKRGKRSRRKREKCEPFSTSLTIFFLAQRERNILTFLEVWEKHKIKAEVIEDMLLGLNSKVFEENEKKKNNKTDNIPSKSTNK